METLKKDPLASSLNYAICSSMNTIPPIKGHINQKSDLWTMTGWHSNEVSFNPKRIIDEVEKLERDLLNDFMNGKNTAPRPFYLQNVPNVITLIGLTESAKRDTDEVSSSLSHSSVGSDATAPAESQTDLLVEFSNTLYARRDYATQGQRKVINQTSKYGMLWDDTSFDTTPETLRETGINWSLAGAANMHARVTFTAFILNAGDLFVVQINELQANA